ncbi:4-hydroxy-tetrahydrodipicolinate synthase [Vagococcus penaei]|uniref:4-hydroxy-tetrahydrodipicolinate synthase n=1 Tax=Vagococcus penaei TaxID=633807 RepID=A0A1Q2D521_9ENTE|nr:4-hydroxy-tetrahydrodipicolinate synthase [Vagococcus penaei]AQP53500.1 4-hydroxy-tetrahydrodipicolinate synthase [Vagococcus penaei]RSU07445.1 4-hydroxy-tetrahydrodipicolinate synthase [Vagococcus penaei]
MTDQLQNVTIWTAMVTPFNTEGKLAIDKVGPLVDYLLANETEGLVVAGTTGESPTLNREEELELFKEVIRCVDGRVPIICGVGTNDTAETVKFIKQVAELDGISAGLCVVPYYNKPSQEGMYRHFKTLSEASNLPIMLYNVPGRTGVSLSVETTLSLAQLPNIIGTKDCQGLEAIAELVECAPDDFLIYTGEDALAMPAKIIGATGVISVASHVVGKEMFAMYQAIQLGDLIKAAKYHRVLLSTYQAVFSCPSPSPVKAILNQWGIEVGEPRLPMVACTNDETMDILTKINQSKQIINLY